MSSSRRKKSTRRTKDQILQELEITQRLLIEKEEELVICQEELARFIQEQPADTNAQPDVRTLRHEIETLETRLAETVTQLAAQEEAIAKHSVVLAQKDAKINELASQLKKRKQKKASAQAPAVSSNAAETQKAGNKKKEPAPVSRQHQPSKPHATVASIPPKPERFTVPIHIAPFTQLVKQNQPFEAAINIDLRAMSEKPANALRCHTRLFAKRLSDGRSSQIGEASSAYEAGTKTIITISDLSLPAGNYHLQAVAAFTTASGAPLPIASLHEGELLQVID